MTTVPLIYRKITERFVDKMRKGMVSLAEAKTEITNTRIRKEDVNEIIKELKQYGVVTLDVKKTNQHTKIKVCNKATARLYMLCFFTLVYLFLLYQWGVLSVFSGCGTC